MPLRLGIDLDGVVADFNAGWVSRYNKDFSAELSQEAVQIWDGLHRLTHFQHMKDFWAWARGKDGESIFRNLEPYEGALEALGRLHMAGHYVVIITSKPDWAIHDTLAWLADRRVLTREVHLTDEKWAVPCDVYLDDAPHQLVRIHQVRPEALTCRFVRPWNRPVPGVKDVANWDEFVRIVEGTAAGAGY
jgi:5'(3')-deoxyribonucleotidase